DDKMMKELSSMKWWDFDRVDRAKTLIIRVKCEDGLFDLPLVVTYPTGYRPGKRYPVLISIYGGPDAGTVFDQWNWNPSLEWYAMEGLVQVSFDHRASGHFGKKGLNYLHRNLGDCEIRDSSTMAKHQARRQSLPNRDRRAA